MDTILNKLFEAADNHGEDTGEPDHTVGDLQDLLRQAWSLMAPSQRMALIESDEVEATLETGAREEFSQDDLLDSIEEHMEELEQEVAAAGYRFMENENGHYWETDDEQGLEFEHRIDAVADAKAHFTRWQEQGDA